ncbi:MAG: gamma-glutamylcyclotransferase [Alphaproteobacteria bacterium]|nr:gamma-glutamylcyclotransferase [Alphaproteobacteria bacterium]
MTRFVYFAYGSNMLIQRLAMRCPSAEVVGIGRAEGYRVEYCLGSPDGSSKAGLRRCEGATAWGVLFSLALGERSVLDGFEGTPVYYRRAEMELARADGTPVVAVTYLPQPGHIVVGRHPFAWYRALCVGGARQHELPAEAVSRLAETGLCPMPAESSPAWDGRAHALRALKAAGLSMPEEGL